MTRLLKIFGALLALVVLLALVILVRTAMFRTKQQLVTSIQGAEFPRDKAVARLSKAIQLKTISHQVPALFDAKPFRDFHAFLESSFPKTHQTLKRETVTDLSLLYTWQGRDPKLRPILLMGHMDVVPVEPGTEKQWTHDPFGGEIADGFLWGRGTLDDKSAVMGIMEAVETLLGKGFQPTRTIYLAFGHNEELGGTEGATAIAALLKSRGVELEYVLDEGLAITEGLVPGVAPPVALIGVAEKGYLTLELGVETKGGHSSMPPAETAIGIMSRALARVEANPLPGKVGGVVRAMFDRVGPEMKFPMKAVFANFWLFSPLVASKLASGGSTNALMRTTTAITIFESGVKENVLPIRAHAVINFRVLPGDTIEGIIKHIRDTIADERVTITPNERAIREASPISPDDSEGYRAIERTIRELNPEIVVAPSLVMGATDSRHFAELTPNIYRFLPLRMVAEDLARLHGTNERIAPEVYIGIVQFFARLIETSAAN